MCPQPPLDTIINPCLTTPAVGAYVTGVISTLISIFLIFIILRTPRRTSIHYFLSLYIIGSTLMFPIGATLATLAGNPKLALTVYRACTAMAFMFSAFYWFARAFLKIKEKWVFALSILHPLALIIVSCFKPGFFVEGVHWNTHLGYYEFEFDPRTVGIGYAGSLFWIWSSWKLLQAYRKSRSIIERNRLKYLSIAPLFLFVGLILVSIPATHIFPFDMAGATITVILLTYAIVRYKLLDINIVIRKGFLYSVLTVVITGTYLLFSLLLQFLFHRPEAPISLPAIVSTAIFIALVFQPLQTSTQRFTDRIFFRRKYDPQELVANLSQAFSETLDLDVLSTKFINLLCQTLQIGKASLFLLNEETKNLEVQKTRNLPRKFQDITFKIDSPLVKFLSQSDEVRARYTLEEKNIPLEGLDKFNLELFVPLRSREKLRGTLVLGPKLSEELYSLEELNLLETIAYSATLALDNASFFTQLSKEKEKVEEARAGLEIKVQTRTKELKELAESLDEQVKQRTKEFQEKVKELERFYRLTVGRELKMIELKKEIKRLKNRK